MSNNINPDSQHNNIETQRFGCVRNKQIKLNNFKSPISFEKVHVGEEISDCLIDTFNINNGYELDIISGREKLTKDLNTLVSQDNIITDDALEKFIKENEHKTWKLTKEDITNALTILFASKENNPYKDNLREVKIGDKTIYIGNELKEDIDLSYFYQEKKHYLENSFLRLYANLQSKKIDNFVEIDNLINTYNSCLDENGKLSDEKIRKFLQSNPKTKDIKVESYKDFLIQLLAPEKTPKEKEKFYKENINKIEKISNKYNRLNKPTQDKNVLIGKNVIKTFQSLYGKPESSSMEYIVEREYYERNNELSNRLFNVRYNSDNLPLSERVKKYNAANCQEYSLLTLEILREKYPNKRLFEIMFQDDDGISDTEHVAVMIFDIADTEENADFYKSEILNINNLSEYLKNVTIIDNWFGGVFKGDDWIKMQSEIHDSKNFNITYIERE